MANRQLVQPDISAAGKLGWCLWTAENIGHTPHDYAVALDSWNATSPYNHPNELPPDDVAVVCYWTFHDVSDGSNPGHVAWSIPGRGILSSTFSGQTGTQWFASVQAMTNRINQIRGAGAVYLGWSEVLAGVRLVQLNVADTPATPSQGGDMAEKITVDTSRILIHGIMARNGVAGRSYALDGQAGGDDLVGQDLSNALVQQLFLSDDGRQWRDSSDPDSVTGINNRLASGDAAQATISSQGTTIQQLQDTVSSVTNDDNATKAQLQDALTKVSDLTAQLKTATDKATGTPAPIKTVVPDPADYFSAGELFNAIFQKIVNKVKKIRSQS